MQNDEKPQTGAGTGGDPAGGADPGGTRPTKPGDGSTGTGRGGQSGARNAMAKSDPIKR